jgi:hypothetical protein
MSCGAAFDKTTVAKYQDVGLATTSLAQVRCFGRHRNIQEKLTRPSAGIGIPLFAPKHTLLQLRMRVAAMRHCGSAAVGAKQQRKLYPFAGCPRSRSHATVPIFSRHGPAFVPKFSCELGQAANSPSPQRPLRSRAQRTSSTVGECIALVGAVRCVVPASLELRNRKSLMPALPGNTEELGHRLPMFGNLYSTLNWM